MKCIGCHNTIPEKDIILQTTIFDSIEPYCKKCWNELMEEEKSQ